jgi:hypothetical protein
MFCDGTESCSGGVCGGSTGDPCDGPDGDADCTETCDETNDNCDANDTDGSACTDGLFCTGTETCTGGVCGSPTGDPCPGADGDGDCSESCDETNDNCLLADPDGSFCQDGLFCNGTDTCRAGGCDDHTGDPCVGPDGDTDCAESCDEAADNCLAADPDGTSCRADTGQCDLEETCLAGVCPADAFEAPGFPCGDGSDTVCDNPDTCDGANNCQVNNEPNTFE